MRISLIVNSSDDAALEQLRTEVERLRRAGHEVDPRITFEGGDAERMAAAAAAAAADVVVAAGGDGTINAVVNGLYGHARGAAAGLPRLGIVPLGTGNDLAAALELPMAVPEAMSVAVRGVAREVDVGMVGERCFLNVSTGGFGAEATEETGEEAKRALGPLAYVVTGVRKFATLEASSARFAGSEPVYDGRFLLYAVGNSRRTGGGNWLTPRADLSDGLLDLCIVTEISRMEFLALLPDLRTGSHLEHPAVLYRQMERITVESEEELSVNADGEPLRGRRFDYHLSPRRLSLMVPRRLPARRGREGEGEKGGG